MLCKAMFRASVSGRGAQTTEALAAKPGAFFADFRGKAVDISAAATSLLLSMKTTFLHLLALLVFTVTPLRAADDALPEKLRAADEERVAAILAADRARMSASFSDDLRYAHSSGVVDDKASYTDSITSGRTKYTAFQYEERNFTFPAPGIALMTGRAHVNATTAAAGPMENYLSFLAVWREEKGQWRFLAWQSCKLLPAPAK